jgi:hypothetical protein
MIKIPTANKPANPQPTCLEVPTAPLSPAERLQTRQLQLHLHLYLHLLQQPALLCYETLHLHVHNTPCTPAIQPPPLPVLHPLNAARCLYGPPQLDAGSVGTFEASDPGPNGRPAVQPSAPIAPPVPVPVLLSPQLLNLKIRAREHSQSFGPRNLHFT